MGGGSCRCRLGGVLVLSWLAAELGRSCEEKGGKGGEENRGRPVSELMSDDT